MKIPRRMPGQYRTHRAAMAMPLQGMPYPLPTRKDPDMRQALAACRELANVYLLRVWRNELLTIGQQFYRPKDVYACYRQTGYWPHTIIAGIEYAWLPKDYQDALRANARLIGECIDASLRLWLASGRTHKTWIRLLRAVPTEGSRY